MLFDWGRWFLTGFSLGVLLGLVAGVNVVV